MKCDLLVLYRPVYFRRINYCVEKYVFMYLREFVWYSLIIGIFCVWKTFSSPLLLGGNLKILASVSVDIVCYRAVCYSPKQINFYWLLHLFLCVRYLIVDTVLSIASITFTSFISNMLKISRNLKYFTLENWIYVRNY